MQFSDVIMAGSVILLSQAEPTANWFTPEKFAMGVAVYLLIRMDKTMKDLTLTIEKMLERRKRER